MSRKPSGECIQLRGVRHNNLKGFDLDLPVHRLIVVTGLSGSGKSSLAFDTLYAEGQRRYIETFSPYARQFFDRMDKPRVDRISGIPPAIAIEQRNAIRTTRSTIGTMTEICDYMKLLWPQLAQLHCRQCGQPVRKEPPQHIWEKLNAELGTRSAERLITFDVPLSEKLSLAESLALIAKQGFQRLLLEGEIIRIDDAADHSAFRVPRSALTVLQDRVKLASAHRARFVEACEQAYHFGKGKLAIHELDSAAPRSALRTPHRFSAGLHCATCNLDYREPSPALFSFNHPLGACPACKGFGRTISIDYNLAIPDRSLTLAEGAVRPWRSGFSAECQGDLKKFCRASEIPMDVPFNQLSAEHQRWVIEGDKDYGTDEEHQWPRAWYGVKGYFRWLESKSYKMHVRVLLSRYRSYTTCESCQGARLNPDALLYRLAIGDRQSPVTLAGFYALSVREALAAIDALTSSTVSQPSTRSALRTPRSPLNLALHEVRSRLQFLADVGLSYLTLDRPTRTLSGGETERVNLTTCLGTKLVNTLYVLDEPSVGLHPRDTARLIKLLQQLRDHGNTVVIVEHEASVMRAADQILDLGPGHGATGGELVFQGTFRDILKSKASLTGQYLSGRKQIEIPKRRPVDPVAANVSSRQTKGAKSRVLTNAATLRLENATCHNLKNVSVEIPLNRFVVITGVSGSGKSTLVRDVLVPALTRELGAAAETAKASERLGSDESPTSVEDDSALRTPHSAFLSGFEHLARVLMVDQSALGKTPRSNPAVYTGAFEHIREVFAQSDTARQRGLNASAFSFNSGIGQCERCRGAGFEKIEMQFLSDVFIRCPDCNGRRYRPHILEVKVRSAFRAPRSALNWSIADALDTSVDEAVDFFAQITDSKPAQRAVAALKLLQDVGLGYLSLGQPINTLSGGESQRLKLAAHLAEAVAAVYDRRLGNTELNGGHRPPLQENPTLFIFDEPTTGLHFDDVRVLLQVFQRLVDAGHSVLVIEHNLDVIKCADWVIDLGPEAGADGGQIVATGTPEDIAKCEASHTGIFLRDVLPDSADERGKRSKGEKEQSVASSPLPLVPLSPFQAVAIHGAREHNLKNLSLAIPRGKFVVVTGVSGSGKSTLAFDLIFAEGQRRFLDSMNAYARQFVEQMARPDVDLIEGLPPTVSIEQRTTRGGGKSTVATVTEIYHFVRLLFARLGTQYCPDCHVPVSPQTRDEVAAQLGRELKQRGELRLLAPMVKRRKGFHTDVAEWALKHGYAEVRADGKLVPSSERLRLDRFKEHNVEIVVGTLGVPLLGGPRVTSRTRPPKGGTPNLAQLIDTTLDLGKGTLLALDKRGRVTVHSTERVCPECNRSFELLDPKNFSYNSPAGWCPKCRGFGELFYIPDVERGANADSIEESWWSWAQEREVCPECNGSRLNPVARAVRLDVAQASSLRVGGASQPRRAAGMPPSLAGKDACATIETFSSLDVAAAAQMFAKLKFDARSATIARDILPEIRERLRFLNEVGLGYLQLGRGVPTLSGGEGQRIRLAAQLGSNLSGVLYVLDEPTIGLHARDNEQLLNTLERLRSRGNSVLVVEHDEDTMRRADFVVDLGPGAGVHGGQVVASGTLKELMRHKDSITGQSLRAQAEKNYPARGERRKVEVPKAESRRPKEIRSAKAESESKSPPLRNSEFGALSGFGTRASDLPWLTLQHAAKNNLRDVSVRFPLGRFVAVTGVSGSGKSTLIRECLLPTLTATLKSRNSKPKNQNHLRVTGHEGLAAVYEVDQTPIGRTPRSIPATYVGFFDDIRQLFSLTPEARIRGYSASRFSFNSAQGRCPECEGAGVTKLEMNFLPPAFVRCESCQGSRFNRETLDIEYAGKNIAQVLDLSVEEALTFFAAHKKIQRALQALHDTGLDYVKLGQTSPTLSGGEAQRVKLVSHLLSGLRPGPGTIADSQSPIAKGPRNPKLAARNLFILEEPTIGLHMADVRRLVDVIQRLVDAGHTVVVIEHNLDLVAEADWVIDLGPEGGEGGGQIVCEGTPEVVAMNKRSHTGRFLRSVLHHA
jgi:excinuclease ABC subunit A